MAALSALLPAPSGTPAPISILYITNVMSGLVWNEFRNMRGMRVLRKSFWFAFEQTLASFITVYEKLTTLIL